MDLDEEQILDYLHVLKSQHTCAERSRSKTPSESFFKHTVYGLRYAYRIFGMKEMRIMLPSIERPKTLPVVLSYSEVKQLLKTPKLLKHRLVLAMLYGCGLRCFELRNLQLKDLDFDRKTVHNRQGMGHCNPKSRKMVKSGSNRRFNIQRGSTYVLFGYPNNNDITRNVVILP